MEIQLTQESVDALVKAVITQKLDEMRFDYYDSYYGDSVSQSFGEYVRAKANDVVQGYIKERFKETIDEEVAEVARYETLAAFLEKPVKISDGYRSTEYESWESYLLKQIHEHSLTDWNVNKKIREEIDKQVKKLWEECADKARTMAIVYFTEAIENRFGICKS